MKIIININIYLSAPTVARHEAAAELPLVAPAVGPDVGAAAVAQVLHELALVHVAPALEHPCVHVHLICMYLRVCVRREKERCRERERESESESDGERGGG